MKRPVSRATLRTAARAILKAGLDAVEPGRLVRANLRVERGKIHAGRIVVRGAKRVLVVAAGKASGSMMRAAREVLGRQVATAILVSPYRTRGTSGVESFVAGHPVPNQSGLLAARRVIRILERADAGDLVLLLLSGGASALLPAPVKGVRLRDKQRITTLLLRRGATIHELNAVRQQISRLKGGGFARIAAPARVIVLAISDVAGDDPGVIGSGPACENPNARTLARQTISKFLRPGEVPSSIAYALQNPPVQPATKSTNAQTLVIGSGGTFAEAAARKARRLGFKARVVIGGLSGEARACGPRLVQSFERLGGRGPACLVVTGETIVRVRGTGIGGRNQELALSAASALAILPFPSLIAAFGTDGGDGPSGAAGGMVDDKTLSRARLVGLSIQACLDRNDSTEALRRVGGLLMTGPTLTNVADIALVLG